MTSRYGFERSDHRREAMQHRVTDTAQRDRQAAREKGRRLVSRFHWVVVDILNDYKQALSLPGELRHATETGGWTPVQSSTGQWGFRESPSWEIRHTEWGSIALRGQEARPRLMRDDVHVSVALDLTDIDSPHFTVQVRQAGQERVAAERNRRRLLEVLTSKTGIRAIPAGAGSGTR